MKKPNWLQLFDQCPPKLCRFVARKSRGKFPMSNDDIAYISGLARCTIVKITKLDSWRSVPAQTIFKFSTACGVDLMNQEMTRKFVRHSKLSHIDKARSPKQRKMLIELLDKLATGPLRALVTALPTSD